jgi:ornithine carbamoyltransferase
MVRHFLDISDFSTSQLRAMLDAGRAIKARRRTAEAKADKPLDGKVVAMIFDQPSLRTRASFEVGGGYGARVLALRRCHHDPHPRSRPPARAG